MSVIDPLYIEMKIIKNRDQNQPLKIGYVTTWAGISKPPYYQPLYNERASFLIERLHGHNSALLYPNVEYIATLCVFTNTSAMDKSVNPSADNGDIAQIKFQAVFKIALRLYGNPPAFVGKAMAQAVLLRKELEYETIFDASGVWSNTVYNLIDAKNTMSGKNFSIYFRQVSISSYNINMTVH